MIGVGQRGQLYIDRLGGRHRDDGLGLRVEQIDMHLGVRSRICRQKRPAAAPDAARAAAGDGLRRASADRAGA